MNQSFEELYKTPVLTPEQRGERNLANTLIATHPDTTLEKFAEMVEERIGSWDDLPSEDWFTPTINPHKNEWIVEDFEAIKNGETFDEIIDGWTDRISEFWYDYATGNCY